MQLRSSLSLKVLILVALPLFVQVGCIYWLLQLQSDAEKALDRSIHANEIANALVHLRVNMYKVIVLAGGEKSDYGGNQDAARAYVGIAQRDYTTLSRLSRDQPAFHRAVEESRSEAMAAFSALIDIKKNLEATPYDQEGRSLLWIQVRRHMTNVLKNDFSKFGDQASILSQRSPIIQAEYRDKQRQIMIGMGLLTFALTAFLGVYVTRGITLKIAKVSDNAYRLVSDRPLNPVLSGSDDLARLDQTFHEMADTLLEASRKERAVVENARDFICSLDGNLKFGAANPAARRILGYEERDLLGQSLVNILPEDESPRVRSFFEELKAGEGDSGNVIETRLLRQGGSMIHAMISAHWSPSEKSFFVVAHDVTDRHQAEQLKQEVVVMVTHDLRTPLATLENILKFLRSGNFGKLDAKGAEYIMVANRNVERMSNLVNDLLDIEKVKSGLMTLDIQAFDLKDCFTAARELSGAFAEEAGVKINIRPTDLLVSADQDRVTRVLANLIANAVKFSPPGGSVTVSATVNGDWVYTTVDDQGPGIPPDQLQHIFERFRQVEGSSAKGKGGSGLGLTICQAIVELHTGKIWAENLPDRGSRFIFTLPAA